MKTIYQVPTTEQIVLDTSCNIMQGSFDIPDTVVDDFVWSEIPDVVL